MQVLKNFWLFEILFQGKICQNFAFPVNFDLLIETYSFKIKTNK